MIGVDIYFFTSRCRKWVINSRRVEELLPKSPEQLYKNCRLCSTHFEDSQFMYAPTKNKLVHDAVPTLFDIPNPPARVTIKRKLPIRHDHDGPKRKKKKGKEIYIVNCNIVST